LPFHRIQRAHELGEIDIQKDPAPSSLGSRNEAALGAHADFVGVHVEKRGGLVEIERSHGIDRSGVLAIWRGWARSHLTPVAMIWATDCWRLSRATRRAAMVSAARRLARPQTDRTKRQIQLSAGWRA